MPLSAICGVLGGGQDGPILDPLLNAMADYGQQRRTRTSGRVRLGCRYADDANANAGASRSPLEPLQPREGADERGPIATLRCGSIRRRKHGV